MPALAHENSAPGIPMVSLPACTMTAARNSRRRIPSQFDLPQQVQQACGANWMTTASDMPINTSACRFDQGTVIASANLFRIAWLHWRKSAPA
jgi:hypothetical protein